MCYTFVSFCFIVFHFVSFCFILFHFVSFCFIFFATTMPSPNLGTLKEAAAEAGSSISNASTMSIFTQLIKTGRP